MRLFPLRIATVLILAVAIIVFGPAGCWGDADLAPSAHIERAREYQDRGEFQAAIIELKNALRQAPDHVTARWLLGKIYVEVDNGEAAEKELRKAIEFGMAWQSAAIPLARALLLQAKYQQVIDGVPIPENLTNDKQAELWTLHGNANIGLGNLDAAEKDYVAALAVQPDSLGAYVGRARLAAMRNNLEAARDWLDKVFAIDLEYSPAWTLTGDIESHERKMEDAEESYTQALKSDSDNLMTLMKRAYVRVYTRNYEGAKVDVDKLKKQLNGMPLISYVAGLLEYYQARYEVASGLFHDALNKVPNYPAAIFFLGLTNYMQGNFEQADRYLSQYLGADPGSAEAARALGATRILMKDYEGAESVLQPLILRNPDDTRALELLAWASLRQGKSGESAEFFRKVVSDQSESAIAHLNLGLALQIQGDKEEALEQLERAIELNPRLEAAEIQVIVNHMKAQDYDKAIEAAERLLEKSPGNAHAMTLKGGAYLAKGDTENARAAFKQVLENSPDHFYSARNLANMALQEGQVDEARRIYARFVENNPGHLNALMSLAKLEFSQGHIEEAKSWVEQAVAANPDALPPRITLASYYMRLGQPSKALALTQDLRAEHPQNSALLVIIGEAQLENGMPEIALATLQHLVTLTPRVAHSHYLLGRAYRELDNKDRALEEWKKALELDTGHLPSRLALTKLYIWQDDFDEAHKQLNLITKEHPANGEVIATKGLLAVRENRLEDAVRDFSAAMEISPSSKLVHLLAQAQWHDNNKETSITTLQEWLEKHPNDAGVQFHLANSYLLLRRNEEAKSAFAKVVELSPNNALALNNLAWLMREENPAKALEYAEQSVEHSPDSARLMDTLGEILLLQGNYTRALEIFSEATRKAPGNSLIRYHYALALTHNGEEAKARQTLEDLLSTGQAFKNRQEAESLLRSLGE